MVLEAKEDVVRTHSFHYLVNIYWVQATLVSEIIPVVVLTPGYQDEGGEAMEGEHTEWDDEGFGGGGGGGATFIFRVRNS